MHTRLLDPIAIFEAADDVIWDFDGVIKDSVGVKADAFAGLFPDGPPELVARVRHHHLENGGVARYEKIPIYADWAREFGLSTDAETLLARFSTVVIERVISSDWIPGVEAVLRTRKNDKRYFLLTATPEDEIREIIRALDLADAFDDIRGAPRSKTENAEDLMRQHDLKGDRCVVIGDSRSDLDAAITLGARFILKTTGENAALQAAYDGPKTEDFLNWTS